MLGYFGPAGTFTHQALRTVTDEEALAAVAFAARELKLVVEPGGAAGLAALLAGKLDGKGRTTAIILSGGNIDPGLFADIIEGRFQSAAQKGAAA